MKAGLAASVAVHDSPARRCAAATLLLCMALAAAGCGQKGPLTLQGSEHAASAPARR